MRQLNQVKKPYLLLLVLLDRFIVFGAFLVILLLCNFVRAEEYQSKGLEISGHVSVVTGWQHDDGNTVPTTRGGLAIFRGVATPNRDTFAFYIDEVQINLEKHFTESIYLRADLAFFDVDGPIGTGFSNVEQGYVGFSLPLGKGLETIIGKFIAPIGFENTADLYDNIALSISNTGGPTPTLVTGLMVHYSFSEGIDGYLYVVDSLNNGGFADSAYPSYGSRLEFTWGRDDNPDMIALNFVSGPERFGSNSGWEFLVDLEFSFALSSRFLLGGEVFFLQFNETTGTTNDRVYSGFVIGQYYFTDTFYGYLRGEFTSDNDAAGNGDFTGDNQRIYEGSIGIGYSIADGTIIKWEYRTDIYQPRGGTTSLSHSVAGSFAYQF